MPVHNDRNFRSEADRMNNEPRADAAGKKCRYRFTVMRHYTREFHAYRRCRRPRIIGDRGNAIPRVMTPLRSHEVDTLFALHLACISATIPIPVCDASCPVITKPRRGLSDISETENGEKAELVDGTNGNASWELIARGFRFEEHEKNVPGIF